MDRYETNALMELKAVTAKYDNAAQLAKYKETLESQGERNVLVRRWCLQHAARQQFLTSNLCMFTLAHGIRWDREGTVAAMPIMVERSAKQRSR
jgi:hypothetical protein